MSFTRAALVTIGIAFIAAEIARPTVPHDKKIASRALLTASQQTQAPIAGTLDPELLNDLPRIWPNAPSILKAHGTAPLRIVGCIHDPYTHSNGAAVFPIVNGVRLADFSASYQGDRYTLLIPLRPPLPQRFDVAVGLVSADQRGYFRSNKTLYAGSGGRPERGWLIKNDLR
ncbi:MAG: hypothetical protein GIX03_07775 [Candidatus Eremiobacteraeota bacterium]|nr:hypothetical protein [Candidatus Eremiobacteraeota bacterium]MBC5802886.1 hypothetical protein [Candidatus Eremiobacteraeota bacterium]MBC5823949.1 hypothetical protein [Candidatus Eremiobacteraeota bacterium]